MNGYLGALFGYGNDLRHFTEVELRINTLREHVHRHGNHVQITGALTITKECAFYPFRSGHQSKLGRCNPGPAIIMGMQADDQRFLD